MSQDKIVNLDKKIQQPSPKGSVSPVNELALKTTKEIVIKFIEMGRCSPSTFEEVFTKVFSVVKETLSKY